MKVHDESKEFKCNICLNLFSTKQIHKVHYRTHAGKKYLACQTCYKIFARKDHLLQHQAAHRISNNLFYTNIVYKNTNLKTAGLLTLFKFYNYSKLVDNKVINL